jgi:hypothetical protein
MFLKLCRVIHSSLNKVSSNGWKKIKLEEEAISEILVAEAASE